MLPRFFAAADLNGHLRHGHSLCSPHRSTFPANRNLHFKLYVDAIFVQHEHSEPKVADVMQPQPVPFGVALGESPEGFVLQGTSLSRRGGKDNDGSELPNLPLEATSLVLQFEPTDVEFSGT